MKMSNNLAGILALLVVAVSCALALNMIRSRPLSLIYERPSQGIANARAGITAMSGNWDSGINIIDLKMTGDLVDEKNAIIVDARSDLFFEFGHIPGAKNLARKTFDSDYVRLENG